MTQYHNISNSTFNKRSKSNYPLVKEGGRTKGNTNKKCSLILGLFKCLPVIAKHTHGCIPRIVFHVKCLYDIGYATFREVQYEVHN